MKTINTYKHKFNVVCPNNGKVIKYLLEIVTSKVIFVEEIVSACAEHKEGYHEDIADSLYAKFEGNQKIKALHHGVGITTYRSKI